MTAQSRAALRVVGLALACGWACASPATTTATSTATATATATSTSSTTASTTTTNARRVAPAPVLPADADPRFAPSRMRVVGEASAQAGAGVTITEVESCAGCHADVAASWRASAHAFASFNNPIYRASVDRFRGEAGAHASRFCGGCHDVALLTDGGLDGGDVAPRDPRAHGGVTCRTCHGIASARPDGNGSYDLDLGEVPIPKEGDAASVERHKAAMGKTALRTPEMCGTCHRVFLDEASGNAHHLAGQDEETPWMRSAWAGSLSERVDAPLPTKECRTCHMPRVASELGDASATPKNGYTIASHRFLGGQTWLASMRGDEATLTAARAMLQSAATIDVAAPADAAAAVRAGERVVVDVVVRNVGAGHRFPAGVLDAQDTWIEVVVTDARGERVAAAGLTDDTKHVLRATIVDDHGRPVLRRETNHFRAVVSNHTIAPRDAEVVRYAFTAGGSFPLHVTARLRHRSRNLELQSNVCDASRTPRGRAFLAEVAHRTGVALDPCKPQPVTDVAASDLWLGAGAEAHADDERHPGTPFDRAFAHALGLTHALEEYVGDARAPALRALSLASNERERAMAYALLAQVAAREGNADEASRLADLAERGAPDHPALSRARGDALAAVWRWQEAAPWLGHAATLTPRDDSSFTRLAIALGSAGERDLDAADVVARGLALQPRDPDLLRVQALCLANAGAPDGARALADQAYLHHRVDDEAPALKGRCSMQVPGCALERDPVHVHEMR